MDSGLLVLIIVIVLMFMVSRNLEKLRRANDPNRIRHMEVERESNGIAKIETAIQLFKRELDSEKLKPGYEKYTLYYIGYLHGIAKTVSRIENLEFNFDLRKPVFLETLRLTERNMPLGEVNDAFFDRLLDDQLVKSGVEDGITDATMALTPGYRGPYWQHLENYFQN